jgi:hypothetical protein
MTLARAPTTPNPIPILALEDMPFLGSVAVGMLEVGECVELGIVVVVLDDIFAGVEDEVEEVTADEIPVGAPGLDKEYVEFAVVSSLINPNCAGHNSRFASAPSPSMRTG